MRTCLRCLLAVSLVLLIAGSVFANEEKKILANTPGGESTRGMLVCDGAIAIDCGDLLYGDNTGAANNCTSYACSPYLCEGGGEVVYVFTLTEEKKVTITMTPDLGDLDDLDLFLLGSCDEDDCLEYSAGTSTEEIVVDCMQPGTYYIVVDGYSCTTPNETSFSIGITCTECPAEPDPVQGGETCEDAVDLCKWIDGGGNFNISYYTDGYANDYSDGACTGYSSNGYDIVYYLCLDPGGTIDVTQTGDTDLSLYLVTDCSDVDAYCVAGSDGYGDEYINYTSTAGGTYYLIVDAYSTYDPDVTDGLLYGTITGCCATATEDGSWGGIKQLFR